MDRDAQQRGGSRPPRPLAEERFAAAVEIASGGSAALRRHARRYSLCVADAEDACQRSLEILLTKAPTAERNELRAWLHTVIKHEALAVRRQRERAMAASDPELLADSAALAQPDGPDERAGGRERAHQTAEALTYLKPSELRCMLLKALGYSYEEISSRTGYSYTKVNRSLTEGRRRFRERFDQVTSGAGCAELEPLLSAAGDGECSPAHEPRLRAHLRACASCRATLRGYRAAPARLAELLPPALMLPALKSDSWWSRLAGWVEGGPAERMAAIAHRLHGSAEMLGAKKAAVVVASTAALAGSAAVEERVVHQRTSVEHRAGARQSADQDAALGTQSPAAQTPPPETTQVGTADPTPASSAQDHEDPGTKEFGFERAGSAAAGSPPESVAVAVADSQSQPAVRIRTEQFGPGGATGGSSGGNGSGEFGP